MTSGLIPFACSVVKVDANVDAVNLLLTSTVSAIPAKQIHAQKF